MSGTKRWMAAIVGAGLLVGGGSVLSAGSAGGQTTPFLTVNPEEGTLGEPMAIGVRCDVEPTGTMDGDGEHFTLGFDETSPGTGTGTWISATAASPPTSVPATS